MGFGTDGFNDIKIIRKADIFTFLQFAIPYCLIDKFERKA